MERAVYITEIEKYRVEGSADEWYFSKLLDKCVSGLSDEQAFREISNIID